MERSFKFVKRGEPQYLYLTSVQRLGHALQIAVGEYIHARNKRFSGQDPTTNAV